VGENESRRETLVVKIHDVQVEVESSGMIERTGGSTHSITSGVFSH
jgi:hypothetical protein